MFNFFLISKPQSLEITTCRYEQSTLYNTLGLVYIFFLQNYKKFTRLLPLNVPSSLSGFNIRIKIKEIFTLNSTRLIMLKNVLCIMSDFRIEKRCQPLQ